MDAIELIKSVGFPVAVAFVLLWRLDRTMVRLEIEVARLSEQIEHLVQVVTLHDGFPRDYKNRTSPTPP